MVPRIVSAPCPGPAAPDSEFVVELSTPFVLGRDNEGEIVQDKWVKKRKKNPIGAPSTLPPQPPPDMEMPCGGSASANSVHSASSFSPVTESSRLDARDKALLDVFGEGYQAALADSPDHN